jgi:mannose-6-phosphate isomerase-like protein (cupin superfamily)
MEVEQNEIQKRRRIRKSQCIPSRSTKRSVRKILQGQFLLEYAYKTRRMPRLSSKRDVRTRMPQQLAYPQSLKGRGQILLCTAGEGWYQQEGKSPVSLVPGKAVVIPAGVKHWHGAKSDSWFSHISVEVPGENSSVEWLEPVSDETYKAL